MGQVKTKTFSLRVQPDLYDLIQSVADRNKTTQAEVLEMCIRSAIKEVDEKLNKIRLIKDWNELVIKEG